MTMNPQPKSLKLIALLLSVMVLMQGCIVYESKPTTIDTALQKGKPVKVISPNSKTLKFRRIEKEGGQMYGFAHWSTKTAKTLSDQIVAKPKNSMYVKIKLDDNQIHEVFKKDKFASNTLTTISIGFLLGIVIYILNPQLHPPGF
jgi:ABC-type uncharacterized transport system auxiliary subunit